MPRFNNVNGVNVQFTSQEETARNAKLAASDWMGNNDVTMPSAWTTYRAALRNVPAQGGFPNSITWPTEPS